MSDLLKKISPANKQIQSAKSNISVTPNLDDLDELLDSSDVSSTFESLLQNSRKKLVLLFD